MSARSGLIDSVVGSTLGLYRHLAGWPVLLGLVVIVPFMSAHAAEPPTADHAAKMAAGLEVFKTTVRSVLVGRCLQCHGGEKTESEFDLSTREKLLKGGTEGQVVKPGDPVGSRLMRLINHAEKPHMPDKSSKLTETAIAAIGKWIELGAPYDRSLLEKSEDPKAWTHKVIDPEARKFWSFQPLGKVAPPVASDPAWNRSPLDQFVFAKLTEKGLTPSAPVDKRRLIRRVYFDLIGLPPSPEEVERFVADTDPKAYERLIDGLLERPQYGERWARYWLDVARFAESHGFEQDYDRPFAYHFRDFVIQALNADLPYNTFVRWQLAGDEIEPTNPQALMATGFLGAGVFPTQITANEVERTRYDALDDMAATTGTAFLGLTVGCARCHDHKFDPIPSADYYRMISTFTTAVRSNIDVNFAPAGFLELKQKYDVAHAPFLDALKKYETEQLPTKLAAWEAQRVQQPQSTAQWQILDLTEFKSAGGATLTKQPDGSLLATGANPDFDTYTVVVKTSLEKITGIRLEALAHESLVKGGPGRADNGNIALTDFRVTAAPAAGGSPVPVVLQNPQATFNQGEHLHVRNTIDNDKKSAWAVDPQFGKDHAAAYETQTDIGSAGGVILTFTLEFKNNVRHNIGRLRLAATTGPRPVKLQGSVLPQEVSAALAAPREKRTAEQTAALLKWFAPQDAAWQKLHADEQAHAKQAPQPKVEKVMVVSEGVTPIRHHTQGADFFNETYYLRRGDCDQKHDVASASFLQVLMRAPDGEKHWQQSPPPGVKTSYRRTALAHWITDTELGAGQLLARVMVNRLWQHHFGQGIVGTANDFGFQGERPTHPELLDYLATEFIRGGWKLKPLHKQMLLSAAYQQGSGFDEAKAAKDPGNRFLWRHSPHRLEAESIRDSMLSISGTLDGRMFGPGTLDEGHTRRSIYFMVKRSQLIPMMQLFDTPEPLVSVGDRPSTTIAPQALMFMNSPHVRRMATSFAKSLLPLADKSPEPAIRRGYLLAIQRNPTDDEVKESLAFFESQQTAYTRDKKPNARELAMADLCQVWFCLNEFVYVE